MRMCLNREILQGRNGWRHWNRAFALLFANIIPYIKIKVDSSLPIKAGLKHGLNQQDSKQKHGESKDNR